jgi:hypothetical protein
MPTSQGAHAVKIANTSVALPWPPMTVDAAEDRTLVLLDPDVYLIDSEYKLQRRSGAPAIRNLWAFDNLGHKLWEAEFPEANDYYYKLASIKPLVALSFSSWRCTLSLTTGQILSKEFLK